MTSHSQHIITFIRLCLIYNLRHLESTYTCRTARLKKVFQITRTVTEHNLISVTKPTIVVVSSFECL